MQIHNIPNDTKIDYKRKKLRKRNFDSREEFYSEIDEKCFTASEINKMGKLIYKGQKGYSIWIKNEKRQYRITLFSLRQTYDKLY